MHNTKNAKALFWNINFDIGPTIRALGKKLTVLPANTARGPYFGQT